MLGIFKRDRDNNQVDVQARLRLRIPRERATDIYAIGDVHGCLDLLHEVEDRILAEATKTAGMKLVVMIGDYIDRGPDSEGVLEHLCKKLPAPLYRIALCGNHDDAFLKFLNNPDGDLTWMSYGGDMTLQSYGIDPGYWLNIDPSGAQMRKTALARVPASHQRFLENAPVSLTMGDFCFVHAGVVPGRPFEKQRDHDLMWIREPFLTRGPESDKTVIHGHTPTEDISFGKGRIGIDTGAFMTGKLSVLRIQGDQAEVF